jgi:CRP-like cAMP-binding protein
MQTFLAYLNNWKWNDEKPLHHFADAFTPLRIKRKTLLTVAGETERYLYFVDEGVQRIFYVTDEVKDNTLLFGYSGSFFGNADSFLLQKPAAYFFETLTASHFLRLHYDRSQQFVQQYPFDQYFLLWATAAVLQGTIQRQIELQTYSNEQKFHALMQRNAHLLNKVPHKYIASYLGMDATNFSKLLNHQKITNHGKCQHLD